MKKAQAGPLKLNDVVGRIIKLNSGLHKFWSKSHGWGTDRGRRIAEQVEAGLAGVPL